MYQIIANNTIEFEGNYNEILQEFELEYGYEFYEGIVIDNNKYTIKEI